MKDNNFMWLLVLLLLPMAGFSQVQDHEELKQMFERDQASRLGSNINWLLLRKEDSLRERRVYQLIDSNKVVTGRDYFHTAMIFQHGKDSIAYGMAVKQMKRAVELDTTIDRWLLAAATDRYLASQGKPQIYGTQYVQNGVNAKWKRYTIDTTVVTAAERKYYGVRSLQEQLEKERKMNLLSVSEFFAKSSTLDKTIALIRREKTKGTHTLYDVSESTINDFGYELMYAGKGKEALAIFTLNTQLYPKGYNTFDSLGECLLGMGKKKQGLAAYKKSLELNPKNELVRIIIAANQ